LPLFYSAAKKNILKQKNTAGAFVPPPTYAFGSELYLKLSFPASQKTHCVFITKTKCLYLHKEIMVVLGAGA
jgi:hypothetical protein